MQTHLIATLLALLLSVLTAQAAQKPSASVLLQKAIYTEETEGDLKAAMVAYREILAESEANQSLAAQAQYRLGRCYQKLGDRDSAVGAFRELVAKFADQTDLVRQARLQLGELGQSAGEVTIRKVKTSAENLQALSSDGRRLLCYHGSGWDLAVCEIASDQIRTLVPADAAHEAGPWMGSAFSPSGDRVAYIWSGRQENGEYAMELYVTPLDTPAPRRIYRAERDVWVSLEDWSPDGRHLLLALRKPGVSGTIGLLSVGAGTFRELKRMRDTEPGTMRFAPDGRWVAYRPFSNKPTIARGLFLIEVSSGRETQVLDELAAASFVGWAPRGRSLVYVSERTGQPGLWTVDLDEQGRPGAAQLLKMEFRGEPLGISQSGTLYYREPGFTSRDGFVAEVDFATGKVQAEPQPVAPQVFGTKSYPAWSPDGQRLAFSLERAREFCLFTLSSREVRRFSIRGVFEVPIRSMAWAPGGEFFLTRNQDFNGGGGIFRFDTRSGEATPIVLADHTKKPTRDWITRPGFTPDGRSFYYARRDFAVTNGPGDRILRHDLTTHQEQTVFEGESLSMFWPYELSPDGRQMALVVGQGDDKAYAVKLRDLSTGATRELLARTGIVIESLRWTPDGKRLVYVLQSKDGDSASNEVWSLGANGGTPVRIVLSLPRVCCLSIHPNSRQLAFQAGEEGRSELWIMENLLPAGPGR